MPGVEVDLRHVETNIVKFRVTGMAAQKLCDEARTRGVLALARNDTVRAVTHLDVGSADILKAVEVYRMVLARNK